MSSDFAIRACNVSKIYSLGRSGRTKSYATIIKERRRHPFRRGSGPEQFSALDDVSFEVAPGEVVGVIGKNGAGKSTLLKILSRITFPTTGYVDLMGRVGSLLEVGTGFHPELTGIENVYLNGSILGMSKREIDSRLDQIIDFSDVHQFLETPVKRYSSGMRVRLAFSVAAHLEPEILIIDEVLSVGDAGFQAKCLDKMRSIASEDGRTVLYVSHNLATLENLCERTLLLESGRLIHDGETAETVSLYLNSFPHASRGDARGVFDLAGVDRHGTELEPLFTRLEVRPNGGDTSETVRMGDDLVLQIGVDGLDANLGGELTVIFGSDTSTCLFRMSGRMKRLVAAGARASHETIVMSIPSLPLTPGQYHVDLVFKGPDTRGVVDSVKQAATFAVIAADVLGTGFEYSMHDGPFVVPWDWEVRPGRVDV